MEWFTTKPQRILSRGGAPCPKPMSFCCEPLLLPRYEVEVLGLFPKTGPHIGILSLSCDSFLPSFLRFPGARGCRHAHLLLQSYCNVLRINHRRTYLLSIHRIAYKFGEQLEEGDPCWLHGLLKIDPFAETHTRNKKKGPRKPTQVVACPRRVGGGVEAFALQFSA